MGVMKFKSLSVASTQETTFCTSNISGFSDTVRVPGEGIEFIPDQAFDATDIQVTQLGDGHQGIATQQGGTLKFKTYACGLSTAAAAGVTAALPAWMTALLDSCGATISLGQGGTCTVGSSTTSIVLTAGHGARFTAGGILGWVNSSSRLETRLITAISTDTLTVTPALSGSPANNDVIYNAAGISFTDQDMDSRSFVAKGDGFEYTLRGVCGKPPKLSVEPGGRAMWEWEFSVGAFTYGSSTSGTLPSFPTAYPIVGQLSPFLWGTSATAVPSSGLALDPGGVVSPKSDSGGVQGRAGWILTDLKPKISAKPYYASGYQTDFTTPSLKTAVMQLGYTIGGSQVGAISAIFHQGQIEAFPGEKDVNGAVGHELSIAAKSSTVSGIYSFVLAFF